MKPVPPDGRIARVGKVLPGALLCACLLTSPVFGAGADEGLDTDCVLRLAETGDADLTLAELRRRCTVGATAAASEPVSAAGPETAESGAEDDPGVVEQWLEKDREAAERPFSIMAHRPNYFLAGAWNAEGWASDYQRQGYGNPDYRNKDIESQFQISLKVPLAVGLFGDRLDLYGAYTNRSFWQVYNGTWSEPFRETNHEPEVWAQFRNSWSVFGFTNSVNTVGLAHQSNGLSDPSSRSWNRVYATFVFERRHWALIFKPWWWVSESSDGSDNPDIDDYMGHGEFRAAYANHGHVFSGMLRNQLESGFDRGALELSWSFPVFDYPYLRGYVQYFYGYGESLIDYDQKVNRIGIGISVTDWLD